MAATISEVHYDALKYERAGKMYSVEIRAVLKSLNTLRLYKYMQSTLSSSSSTTGCIKVFMNFLETNAD